MRLLTSLLLSILAMLLIAGASPANAGRAQATDPAGDGLVAGLDITSVIVRNRDHAVVTTISFVRAVRGSLLVSYWARGTARSERANVLSEHRPRRGDVNRLGTRKGWQPCNGLRVTWNHDKDTVKVRLPSKCLRGGDYGAVRLQVFTEIGADNDFAPKGPEGEWKWTPWAARG